MKNDLFSWLSTIWLALFLLPATLAASAPDRPSTDAEKIADALRPAHASSRRMRRSSIGPLP